MNILLSGGTGLVGTELGKVLAEKGHKLFVLTRDTENAKLSVPYPHFPVYWDAMKNSPPSDVVSEMDAVINLAGINISDKRWSDSFKTKIYNSRVLGTQNLVRAINDHGRKVRVFISTSATGYYGATGPDPVHEDANASHGFLGKLCVAWESPVENFLKENIRKVILRLGVVFSERGGALAKMIPPLQAGIGGALGSGQQMMGWIDIEDLVKMYVFALETEISGTFNAVAPQNVTNRQLTNAVATRLQSRPGPAVPAMALRIVVGEMAQVLVENQAISSEKIVAAGFRFNYPDVASSLALRVPALKRSEQRRIYEQWIPKPREEVWDFFSDAKNLEKLTPPFLRFQILDAPAVIVAGSIIKYRIHINGIPVTWVTRIAEWEPPVAFADNQESGPYKKWYHRHQFLDLAGGTLLYDQVDSIVPLGTLGLYTLGYKVYHDVQQIFEFRRKVIGELFGTAGHS